MSGVLKSLGKVFKSVVKVVKKIALPALAIGAVVLTGGAALGLLPALGGAGGLLAGIGVTGGLASVITSAATAATIGFGGSLLMGKDPIKGATTGLLVGGLTGGIGAAFGGLGGAASGASAAGSTAGTVANSVADASGMLAPSAAAAATAGLPAALAAAAPAATAATSGGIGSLVSGLGSFINKNPLVAGQIISGVGSGIAANEQAKAIRAENQQIRDNYSNTSGLYRVGSGGIGSTYQTGAQKYSPVVYAPGSYVYDPATGRIVPSLGGGGMIGQQMMGAAAPQQAPQPQDDSPQPSDPTQGGGAGDSDVQGQQPNVTAEEQAQYDQFVKNGLRVIYPEGGHTVAPAILAHLKGQFGDTEKQVFAQAQPPLGELPNDSLAATTTLLVLTLDGHAGQSNHHVEDDVLYHGGVALLEELAEVSQAAGIHDYSQDEMEAATYRALDLFRVSSPRVDQDQLKQQFGQIVDADKSGQLDQVLPGIGSRIQQSDQQPQQAPPDQPADAAGPPQGPA